MSTRSRKTASAWGRAHEHTLAEDRLALVVITTKPPGGLGTPAGYVLAMLKYDSVQTCYKWDSGGSQ